MAWTATGKPAILNNNRIDIPVVFSDGTINVNELFSCASAVDFDNLSARVDKRRLAIEELYAASAAYVPGLITIDQEEADFDSFRNLIAVYRNLEIELKAGVGGTQQSDLDKALGDIKTAYSAAEVAGYAMEPWTALLNGLF